MKRRLLSVLILLLVCCLVVPKTVYAEEMASGTYGDTLAWSLDYDGTLTVSGSGEWFYPGWGVYKEQIKRVVVEDGITGLPNYAFEDCTNLTSVQIAGSVKTIACRAFAGCTALTEVTFSEGLETIEERAFKYCPALTGVIFPQSLKNIGEAAFMECFALKKAVFSEGLVIISDYAFKNCSSLVEATLPNGLEEIGMGAFTGCSSLKNVTLPKSLLVMKDCIFQDCSSLTSIAIPYGCDLPGRFVSGCTSLKEITIPVTMKLDSWYPFEECISLTDLYYTGTKTEWKQSVADGVVPSNVTVHCLATEKKPDLLYQAKITDGPDIYKKEQVTLPDFAKEFYAWLVEGTDRDGIDDILIDAATATPFKQFYTCEFDLTVPAAAQSQTDNERRRLLMLEADAACDALSLACRMHRWEDLYSVVSSVSPEVDILTDGSNQIKIICNVYLTKISDKAAYLAGAHRYDTAISTALAKVPEGSTRYEQVKAINAHLTAINGYNSLYPNQPISAHNVFTALEGHYGPEGPVCEAYAEAFKHLCNKLGIPCVYVCGTALGESHAWNYVKMEDNNWYAVDVTWNDPGTDTNSSPISGYECEDYLLVGSETFTRTHTVVGSPNGERIPVLSETAYIPSEQSYDNGWYQKGDDWFFYRDGKQLKCEWLQQAGIWYYLDAEGVMATGWAKDGTKWYYFNSAGAMQTGWEKIDGKWYYLKSEMKTGWQKIDGKWYYLKNEMKTGWQKIGNNWYYLGTNGAMQTGWQQIDGEWYYLKSEMKTGWQKIGNNWYYLGTNGAMQTGWVKLSGKWYYLNENGAMVTGTQKIDGKTYKFNSSGVWIG